MYASGSDSRFTELRTHNPPRRKLPMWAIALGALLGLNLLFVAWLVTRPSSSPASSPAIASTEPQTQTPAAPPGMVTVPATATYIPANAASNVTVGPGATDAGVVAPSAAPPLVEEPMLASGEPSVPPDYDTRDYAPAITPAQANSIAAARRAGVVQSRDEVIAQGTNIPDLRLDLHVYDPDPAKRFVFINMRKLREGESLPDGVRLDEISQRGARLTYRGTQFTLEAN